MKFKKFLKKTKGYLFKIRFILINNKNRKKLKNLTPTIISSDCTGGILYHWLGLNFNSPFINLYMNNYDFLTALENFDEFIESEIIEDKLTDKPFPVGIGKYGVKIFFMHYPDFETALYKWNERKRRIDKSNIGIIFSNLGEGVKEESEFISVVKRFHSLPFRNKIVFVGEDYELDGCYKLKDFDHKKCINICYYNKYGKRYIDQFDYVQFINSLTINNI